MYNFENINFEEYANVLHRAVYGCDTQSRRNFFIYSCNILQKLFHIEYPLEFGSLDSELDPLSKGKFIFHKDNSKYGCKVLINDKLLKTDKTAEMDGCVDFFTRALEENNAWKIPLTILYTICHEFKHAYDYFNDKLVAINLSKLKNLSDDEVKAIYFLSPAEITARKVQIELSKEILIRLLPFCQNERHYSLSVYIEENMLTTLNKELATIKRAEHEMTMVLEDANIKIRDYILPILTNDKSSTLTQEK